jgi:hypothetical protein
MGTRRARPSCGDDIPEREGSRNVDGDGGEDEDVTAAATIRRALAATTASNTGVRSVGGNEGRREVAAA